MSVYGGRIARDSTGIFSTSRPAAEPQDAEASLRAELSAKIANAQSDLENQLAALRNAASMAAGGDALAQALAQLHGLSRLQQRIIHADASALIAIRGEVAASVAATQALVQQAGPASTALQSAQAALYEASATADRTVRDFNRDFYERRIFDPYLRFTSTEDEEEYRRHEQERQRAIEKALAENTPEGNLRANQLAIEQLKDAGAHGADRSPDFKPTMDRLQKSSDALTKAIEHQRQPTRTEQATATQTPDYTDPLQSVGAKAPEAKGVAAVLLAAGISKPQTDNMGHGVNDRSGQITSPVRGG